MPEAVEVGDVLEGVVTCVERYGLFVEVNGIPGLIRITELSLDRVVDPGDIAGVGETVKFQVVSLNDPISRPHEHFNGSITALS